MSSTMASEQILRASLHVLHVAAYTTRNWTLANDCPLEQINALWEALHVIPALLMNWRDDDECHAELRMYLQEYDGRWESPKLETIFKEAMQEFDSGADATRK